MKKVFIQNGLCFFLGIILVTTGCTQPVADKNGSSGNAASTQPALSGRLFFHTYSCYNCNDSKLYQFDFSTKLLRCISGDWAIANPMNAHVSPDGRAIVFMGVTAGSGWDIFYWRIGTDLTPRNLTATYGTARDEDPKFSFAGNKIVFKQNGVMKEMDTLGIITRSFAIAQQEASMPYYTKGDSLLLFSGNEPIGSTADISLLRLNTGTVIPLSANPGLEEYYPVTCDDSSFYFTRWYSADNHNDQIYLGYIDGRPARRFAFNEVYQNYSDACPVDNQFLIISSTTTGGRGGYDLYLVDRVEGKRWSLDLYMYGINSPMNELGAVYTPY